MPHPHIEPHRKDSYYHFLLARQKSIDKNNEMRPAYTCCGMLVNDEIIIAGVCPVCSMPPNTDGTYGEPNE